MGIDDDLTETVSVHNGEDSNKGISSKALLLYKNWWQSIKRFFGNEYYCCCQAIGNPLIFWGKYNVVQQNCEMVTIAHPT